MTTQNSTAEGRRIPSAAEVRIKAAEAEREAARLEGTPEWHAAFARVLELHRLVSELEALEAGRRG